MRGELATIVLVVLTGLVPACGDASTSRIGPKGGSPSVDDRKVRSGETDGSLDDDDGTNLLEEGDASAAIPGDDDGDGVPNADDCDPASKSLGRRIAEDALASDKALFAAAPGFPTTSWTFDGAAAYRQTRLADASDASFYAKDADIGDVQIEVLTASTEVTNLILPRLRQIFVLVGAVSSTGTLTAHGCGIEVVQGESPEQKTSIVKLEGTTTNVVTTVLQRVSRPAVQTNEDLAVKLRFEGGAMICEVTQVGETTTATANGLGALKGSVGLFTRQTKALFKNLRICALK